MQRLWLLLIDGDIGLDTGVNEQVVPDGDHVLEGANEDKVALRNRLSHHRAGFVEFRRLECGAIDGIGEDCFTPAVGQEAAQDIAVLKAAQHHLLVVAAQNACRPAIGQSPCGGDHAGRISTAVDEVAEQHDRGLGRRTRRVVGFDTGQQCLEQVAPAVDIAHGIDPLSARNRGKLSGPFGPEKSAYCAHHDDCCIAI